jgi:ParB family transcriptional regulator, chromosome partitioning protein
MTDTLLASDQVLNLPLDALMPDPAQPRKHFNEEEITRLAASLASRGVLQPLRVLYDEEREKYRIIIGESRWRAARIAGLSTVPCLPVKGQPTETDILSDQIIENAVRHNLSPMDLARAIAKLKILTKSNSRDLAKYGLSAADVCRAEALLTLSLDVQAMVDSGALGESVAYEISRLPDETSQRILAEGASHRRMTRDQVAETVRAAVGKKKVKPKAARLPLRLEDGIFMTVSADRPLTWDAFNAALDRLRKEAKKLCDAGKELSELPRSFRAL